MIEQAIKKLVNQEDLTYNEARQVMDELMSGQASAVQTASYLTALAMKGETVAEITASAEGMRAAGTKIHPDRPVVEIVGTGGDHSNSFNISTTASLIVAAAGFVYCVSSLGVTGVRNTITTDISAMVQLVKHEQDIPCAVGFGISTPAQAREMAQQADGVIVGSAIVRLCEKYGQDCVQPVADYVRSMKDAIRDL